MPAYYETTIRKFVTAPGLLDPVTSFDFTRDNSGSFAIQFLQNGVAFELGDGSETGQFIIKPAGVYDGDAVVAALAWTKTGTGASTVYSFNPNFSGNPAIDALLHIDNDFTNDLEFVPLMGAIKFVVAGVPDETRRFTANVYNNVVRGSETAPVSTTAALPAFLPAISALNSVAATGRLTSDNTNVANGAVVTIGNKSYTYKPALTPTEGEVLIGADADGSLTNLARAINHTGTPGTDYSCAAAHSQVSASAVGAHGFTLTARTPGTAANAYATTETSGHLSFAAATLSGGVDGLNGVATVSLPVGKLVSLVIAGVLQTWQLQTEGATTSFSRLVPLDYNGTTNTKLWQRVGTLSNFWGLPELTSPSYGVEALASVPTANINAVTSPLLVSFIDQGDDPVYFVFQLFDNSGNGDASSADTRAAVGQPNDSIVPDDYDAVSNCKVWVLISRTKLWQNAPGDIVMPEGATITVGPVGSQMSLLNDGSIKPVHLTDASARADSIYYSTTSGKLAYKDAGGTVHALY